VNGTFVSLRHELKTGDVVEIITSKSQNPSRGWLNIAKTSKALQKIKKFISEHEKIPTRALKAVSTEKTEDRDYGILVCESIKNPNFSLAHCCNPLPGDKITGIVSRTNNVLVHKSDCEALEKSVKKKAKVDWRHNFSNVLLLKIEALDRLGLFADILNTISSTGTAIQGANAKVIGKNMAECTFKINVEDLEHIKDLIDRIKKVQGIRKVHIGSIGL